MSLARCLALALVGALLFGCTSDTLTTTKPSESTETEGQEFSLASDDSQPAATPDAPQQEPGKSAEPEPAQREAVSTVEATTQVDTTAASTTETDPPQLDTPQAYMEALQTLLSGAGLNQNSLAEAVALSDEGHSKFPEDDMLLRTSAVLRHRSLSFETDESKIRDTRLELGELARSLVELHDGSVENLDNIPTILVLEEAKAHVAAGDQEKALQSLRDSRGFGLTQQYLDSFLLMDTAFASILENDEAMAEIKSWIAEDVDQLLADAQSFPLEFSLRPLNSEEENEVQLSDFQGKLAVVDFWGTWCPPCRMAIPHLVELQENHKDDVSVVGVNFERGASFEESKEKLDSFLATQSINYPCLYGEEEVAAQVPDFGSFPTMVFLDRRGIVRLMTTGYLPSPKLEVIIDTLLLQ